MEISKTLKIYTEGDSDVNFLMQYLPHALKEFKFQMKDMSENGKGVVGELLFENFEIHITATGGYTNIKNYIQFLHQHKTEKHPVLIIQDADSAEKNHGTYSERMKYFSDIKSHYNIEFNTFLFPNNQDDGDLETLLTSIITGEKYTKYFDCYQEYQSCIKHIISKNRTIKNCGSKDILFNYCYNVLEDSMPNEKLRTYKTEDWNFNHTKLNTLKVTIEAIVIKLCKS